MPAFDPSAPKFHGPDPTFWRIHPALAQVRANALELTSGAKDPAPSGPVQMLQQALLFWGARHRSAPADLLPKFGADRMFGAETKLAVIDFQKAHKDKTGQPLAADGIVGDLTLGALEKYVLAPQTPPTPPTVPPASKVLTIPVDFVALPGGIGFDLVEKMIEAANEVYTPINIKVKEGTRVTVDVGREIARVALYANKFPHPDAPPGVRGVVHGHTVHSEWPAHKPHPKCPAVEWPADKDPALKPKECPALELGRLARNPVRTAHGNRPTVYFTAMFPDSALGIEGTTKTMKVNGVPPTILIPTPKFPIEVFWHELGHALMDSVTDDHRNGTILEANAMKHKRGFRIDDDQAAAMRATAGRWT